LFCFATFGEHGNVPCKLLDCGLNSSVSRIFLLRREDKSGDDKSDGDEDDDDDEDSRPLTQEELRAKMKKKLSVSAREPTVRMRTPFG